jgi:hypothetical protein
MPLVSWVGDGSVEGCGQISHWRRSQKEKGALVKIRQNNSFRGFAMKCNTDVE